MKYFDRYIEHFYCQKLQNLKDRKKRLIIIPS